MVNSIHGLTMGNNQTYFELSTSSVFIHGNKSQVKFDYYGQSAQRELGDLIFIISVVFNNKKYLEKFTINQFKKDKRSSKNILWSMDNKEQLYLLSRFPTFKGVRGSLIPMRDFNLQNYSGSLGSYGFLQTPGDFAFVSATKLESYLGSRKTINGNDLYTFHSSLSNYYWWPFEIGNLIDIEEWFYICHKLCRHERFFYGLEQCWPNIGIFGNCHYTQNIHDFVDKYLRLCIGEPTLSEIGINNLSAYAFLVDLLQLVKRIREEELTKFVDSFFSYHYAGGQGGREISENIEFDPKGGGVGIIYTTINLGEGE
ncbi:MAG: hypothetical protein HY279_12085 [Nitrospinae bacterium]|nr:hypothetical protein [Nitrospinota bacterium]